MAKARKYYAILKITADNLAQQNIFNIKGDKLVEAGEMRLTIAHDTAFKTKKEAIEQLKFAPYTSMLTIIEIYLILEK